MHISAGQRSLGRKKRRLVGEIEREMVDRGGVGQLVKG
jgi:hypothetical protein